MAGLPKGYKFSEEHKRNIGKANKGKKRSTEIRKIYSECKKGNRHPSWNGGKVKKANGYVYIYSDSHPYTNCDNYVMEHRLVMEAHLGRTLLPTERVHHINGIKDDNRIENLMLFSSISEHTTFHHKQRRSERGLSNTVRT